MGALFTTPAAGPLRQTAAVCATTGDALAARYTALAKQLPAHGFDEVAIQQARASFTLQDAKYRPKLYKEPPWSLPSHAVRAIVLAMGDGAMSDPPTAEVAELALQAAQDLARALPLGTQTWLPERKTLHATVFHPGLAPGTAATPGLTAPTSGQLEKELQTARRLAASVPGNLTLLVDQLLVTPSGVMLLLLRPEHNGGRVCMESLRAASAALFPGAASKQARDLVHVSLLRIISLPPGAYGLGAAMHHALEVCERWSKQLRGRRVSLRGLLYVREEQIMTLKGGWRRLPFAGRRRRRLAPGERKLFKWMWGDRASSALSGDAESGRGG